MRFDVDRLSQLAGIGKRSDRLLSEAGNRSQHEDRNSDESDYRWGKNQLNEIEGEPLKAYEARGGKKGERSHDVDYEMDEERGGKKGDRSHDVDYEMDEERGGKKGDRSHDVDYEDVDELNDAYFLGEENEEDVEEDIVLEIDEGMLRREIRRIRAEKINESKLRSAVRNEIRGIFEDLGVSDSSWVYGDNQPKNSRKGSVNLSFSGPGFW